MRGTEVSIHRTEMLKSFLHTITGISMALVFGAASGSALTLENLTANGRANPLGISAEDISFGWAAHSEERGAGQEGYQIRVGAEPGLNDVWDSGPVESARQVDIPLPSSVELLPGNRYFWQVRIRDREGRTSDWSEPAWFETGLLAEEDWSGAEWITRPIEVPDLGDWTDYSVRLEFTLHREAFGVFLRASEDGRNAYLMQVNVTGNNPAFRPHRRANGNYTVLDEIDLTPFGFSNISLTDTRHTLEFEVNGTTITTKLNDTVIDTRSGIDLPRGLVGFRTHGEEAGSVHRVTVVDRASGRTLIDPDFSKNESGFSAGFITEGALQISGHTDAVFANLPSSLPLVRGQFNAREGIASARLYASAQGIYEVWVNGRKAGDQYLAPGWTDYETRIQSQTYDVTDLIQPGNNVIGAALADGWHRGKVGIGWTHVYGDRLALVAKLKINYTDGSSEWFATGPDWKAADGPFIRADLQDGERYDANLEQPGWDIPVFDDQHWQAVETVPGASDRLTPQPDEPVRVVEVLTAQSRTEILPGTWIYDLGQNLVGVPEVRLTGQTGQTVTFRHGEDVYRTGERKGQLYTANLRAARATNTYTFARDETVTYRPLFTQHGFRYVEITGTDNPPAAQDVKGIVLASDLPDIGELETSHSMLNQLVSNIYWGQRGNFLSIPTDTPARDERLGWTGDINVFAPAAARLQDTRAFLSKWMTDVRDAQMADGNIPAVVPQPRNEFADTGVGWADAAITIPYAVWRAFGDERIIRENWEAMKTFQQFLQDSAARDGTLLEEGRISFFSGDWLTLENVERLEEHKVIGTAYFAENTRMMSEMAAVMGESAKAEEWAALVPRIREAFVEAYRSEDGSIHTGTQTAYALTLGMDMIADPAQRAETAERFVEKLASDDYHLRTGFLGTPWLLPALSGIGRDDLAMRLLLNETYPSWGFPISLGATTMWERWNSIGPEGEFGPVSMNSFNHYAYGAVGDWMFANIGGLQALEPGYKKSRIAPLVGYGDLTHARCRLQTPYGPLSCEWELSGDDLTMAVTIPFNTHAEVVIPAPNAAAVHEATTTAEQAAGVKESRYQDGELTLLLGSGTYTFTVRPAP